MSLHLRQLAMLLLLAGCDPTEPADDGGAPDAGAPIDTGPSDAGTPDAGTSDAPLPATAVELTYRAHTETLPRAVYGYERAGGVITEIYLELLRGGEEGCPSESSPTPDQTLVVSGYTGTALGVQQSGITTAFFDFEGIFRDEVAPARSTATRLELLALDQEAGIASGTIEVTFDEGSASGAFTAVHCDSLDAE